MNCLKLGCGNDKKQSTKEEEWVNLDNNREVKPDVLWNLEKAPYPFKDNTFDYIEARHILEHLSNLTAVMEELHRILKPGGALDIRCPHFNHLWAAQDPTHKTLITPTTFHYFTEKQGEPGKTFNYYTKARFEITETKTIPDPMWRWIPAKIRNYLSLMIGQLNREIIFKLKAIKN